MMTLPRAYPQSVGTFQLSSRHTYTIGPDANLEARRMAEREPWIAVDIETAGLGEAAMDIKSVCIGTTTHAVILDPRDNQQMGTIWYVLNHCKPKLIFHNAPYDVPLLVRNGLMEVEAIARVEDTLIYARLAEPDERTQKNLGACGIRYLGGTPGADALKSAFKAAGMTMTEGYKQFDLDRPVFVFGAADDVLTTAAIYPRVMKAAVNRLRDHPFGKMGLNEGWEIAREIRKQQTINRMHIRRSCKGFRVDYEFLDDYRATNSERLGSAKIIVDAHGVTTPAKLIAYLVERNALPFDYPRTPKGGYSTAAASLELLDDSIADAYKLHKDLVKIDRDYLQKCVDLSGRDGRIHPTTNVLGAQTGRESMNTPPIQQFPEDARGIILAEPGDSMVSIDWSQIEPVIIANMAHDFDVLEQYEDGTGDLYTTVSEVGGIKRKMAKITLLASLYGQGMTSLCRDLGVGDKEGYAIRDAVFSPMPRVAALLKRTKMIGDVHGCIFTVAGRIVPVDPRATYRATNYLVQGSAYDVLAEAMLAVEEAGLGDALYFALHDELVVSKDAAHDVRKIMETPPARLIAAACRVPVLRTDMAEMGERWASV